MEQANLRAARQSRPPLPKGFGAAGQAVPPSRPASSFEESVQPSGTLADIHAWIQTNPRLAVLSGFALGVLMGVWMED